MRRGRTFIYLALILVLGLVALVLVKQRLMTPVPTAQVGNQQTTTAPAQVVNAVVVSQRIPRGALVEPAMLSQVPWQEDLFMEGMFRTVEEVQGRQARFDLEPGLPLTNAMLVDKAEQLSNTGSVAALSIPRGMVAVSIPVSRLSSVSYAPQSGDHVNVIVTLLFVDVDPDFQTRLPNNTAMVVAPGPIQPENGPSAVVAYYSKTGEGGSTVQGKGYLDEVLSQTFYIAPSENQRPRMVSQTLLQDVVVLHMGDFPVEKSVTAPQPSPTPTPENLDAVRSESAVAVTEPPKPDVISLVVTPQDAVTLNYLIYSGAQMTLALRGSGDDTRIQTEAVTLQFLLDQYNVPLPIKLPYSMEPRVDELVAPSLPNDVQATPSP